MLTGTRQPIRSIWKTPEPGEGEWRHIRVSLVPENKDFPTIELAPSDEGEVACVAEFVETLA